jgi:hypothetical protein
MQFRLCPTSEFLEIRMGTALLALVDLLTPLHALASRWIPACRPVADHTAGLRYVSVLPGRGTRAPSPESANDATCASPRPLRVVHMRDAQQRGRAHGRMVLSGRLADVCAELDRLAAIEAAELSRSPATLH